MECHELPMSDAELWHFRLVNASYKTITKIPEIPHKLKAITKGENACEACLTGKMKESFLKKTENRTSKSVVVMSLRRGIVLGGDITVDWIKYDTLDLDVRMLDVENYDSIYVGQCDGNRDGLKKFDELN
ncbi:hypothetical protein K3495_g14306 [Podosphaera aphanis]|nr:hypothetical protein K3495_g14306 [Podosphaera aphanis]